MRVSTGQIKQLLELDGSRENVGNAMQVFLRDLQQRGEKNSDPKKNLYKGKKHLIDLDAAPFTPKGWEVEEHQNGGQFEWDVTKVNLYQQNGKVIQGYKLREELQTKNPFNANLLDFLLAHPNLIPKGWKGNYVYFWGTIYRGRGDNLCVRSLFWGGGQWRWNWLYLEGVWDGVSPAAVPAS